MCVLMFVVVVVVVSRLKNVLLICKQDLTIEGWPFRQCSEIVLLKVHQVEIQRNEMECCVHVRNFILQ